MFWEQLFTENSRLNLQINELGLLLLLGTGKDRELTSLKYPHLLEIGLLFQVVHLFGLGLNAFATTLNWR